MEDILLQLLVNKSVTHVSILKPSFKSVYSTKLQTNHAYKMGDNYRVKEVLNGFILLI